MYIKSYMIFLLFLFSIEVNSADLKVTVNGVGSSDGIVVVALFSEEESDLFPEEEPERVMITDAENGSVTVIFTSIPAGEYAIAAFHDKNNNGELDKSGIGLPEEPYGNTGIRSARKPLYENSKFEFSEDEKQLTIEIE